MTYARRKRRDGNHAELLEALKLFGWSVFDTSQIGGGGPDAFASRRGRTVACEFKKPKGKLKLHQIAWLKAWQGDTAVLRSVADVEGLSHGIV